MHCKLILFGWMALSLLSVLALPPLRVDVDKLVAGGREIKLRGINWGWWGEKGTRYIEDDMKNQSLWGANVLRLTFSYRDLLDKSGQWDEKRLSAIDQVIYWAEKYNQYVIFDMHEVPGGQSPVHYCENGKNAFWRDITYQDKMILLWKKIAARYRNKPTVAAYELMNEPQPPHSVSTLEMMEIYKRIIREIRTVDPDKILVVSGNYMSDAKGVVDAIKVNDSQILYTFHFYNSWLGNQGEHVAKDNGTRGWIQKKLSFELSDTISRINILLRSDNNSGSALFDDVSLEDENGNVLLSFGFDHDRAGFVPERLPHSSMTRDAQVGCRAPGALRVSHTTSYNGFSYHWIRKGNSRKFTLKAYCKLENATGRSYIAISQFGWKSPDALREALIVPIRFKQKFKVPVWVGEFGVTCDNPTMQKRAVKDHIRVFEEQGFHWTYWNFHETANPNQMALQAQNRTSGCNYPLNESLLEALQSGWIKNK